MDVRVVAKRLPPGVRHGKESDLCSKVLVVCGDLLQGFCSTMGPSSAGSVKTTWK